MTFLLCNGVRLGVELAGEGSALLLVHGSWTDKRTWDPVFVALARHFRVIRYDRRGYGESDRPGADLDVHTRDLLGILRTLHLSSVTLLGSSLGALIAIRAALAESDSIVRVVAHEPPLEFLERDAWHEPVRQQARAGLQQALDAARRGKAGLAAKTFIEQVTSSPGSWECLPQDVRRAFEENAPAFFAEVDSLDSFCPSASAVRRLGDRLVFTRGDRSSPYLRMISEDLCRAIPSARTHVFAGAGHVPHQTSPEEFVARTRDLLT